MAALKAEADCPWCQYRKTRCTGETYEKCDFRTLKMQKPAIIKRISEESKIIQETMEKQKKGLAENIELLEAIDKLSGIMTMIRVLKEKFGMTDEEIRKEAGFPQLSWAEKMSLMVKVKMMQSSRGGAKSHPNAKVASLRRGK